MSYQTCVRISIRLAVARGFGDIHITVCWAYGVQANPTDFVCSPEESTVNIRENPIKTKDHTYFSQNSKQNSLN